MPQLDQTIWDGEELRPEVAESLQRIADLFLSDLSLDDGPVEPADVLFVGSLAGYNYGPASDVDLHVLVDPEDISEDEDAAVAYFWARAKAWNLRHDVKIRGRQVEVFAQPLGDVLRSRAVYSVMRGEWIKRQDPATAEVPRDAEARSKRLAAEWARAARKAIAEKSEEGARLAIESLYRVRRIGLDQAGEVGAGNLAFKIVRSSGLLDELKNFCVDREDKALSVKQE